MAKSIDKKQARKKKLEKKSKSARTRQNEINRLDKFTIINPYLGMSDTEYLSDCLLYQEVMESDLTDGQDLVVPTEIGELALDAKGFEFIKRLNIKRGGFSKSTLYIKYWIDKMMA